MMRMAAGGGPPQTILEVKGYPGSARVRRETGMRVLTATGQPDFRCPREPGHGCILSEADGDKLTFYQFDPQVGKKTEAAQRIVHGTATWDLSPDGSKIALAETGRNDRIEILTTGGSEWRESPTKGFWLISDIGWAADGASLFVTGTAPENGSILRHVSLDGASELLYKADAWLERPLASPDGHYLAFGQATSSSNVWTIENF